MLILLSFPSVKIRSRANERSRNKRKKRPLCPRSQPRNRRRYPPGSPLLERKLYLKVYNIFSEDRHRKANEPFSVLITIIQSFTTNINANTATYNFFYLKKEKNRARKAGECVRLRTEENSFMF